MNNRNLPINWKNKTDQQIDEILKIAGCNSIIQFNILESSFAELNGKRMAGFYNVLTSENIEFNLNQYHNSDEYQFTYNDFDEGWIRYGIGKNIDKSMYGYISSTKKEYAVRGAKWLAKQFSNVYISMYYIDILLGPNEESLDFKLDADFKYIKDGLNESFFSIRKVGQMLRKGIMKSDNTLLLFEEWDKV